MQVLLVSSSRYKDLFIVPAGGVDPGEELSKTAEREALEEVGACAASTFQLQAIFIEASPFVFLGLRNYPDKS